MHSNDRWDEAQPEEREDAIEAARAAIEAMREPTLAMIHHATCVIAGPIADDTTVTDAWAAMIDEALKD